MGKSALEPAEPSRSTTTIPHDHLLIYYHGRWDSSPCTWWTGSGFKLLISNLSTFTLVLGPHTSLMGVSFDRSPFRSLLVHAGANEIPLALEDGKDRPALVEIVVLSFAVTNRLHLSSIVLNSTARLLPYTPLPLSFQFIGDSLTSGYSLPAEQGITQVWPYLVAQKMGAEQCICAQPGICLTEKELWGNKHGMAYQYFQTEDARYYCTADHDYVTPWDFSRQKEDSETTHVVLHLGANDAAEDVPEDEFISVYLAFLSRLRGIYKTQPFLILAPWGWPRPDGGCDTYYGGVYARVVASRHEAGDTNVFLVDTTGWVSYEDVDPKGRHPNEGGHARIAEKFADWMDEFRKKVWCKA